MNDSSYWIKQLKLQPHPEGGFYRETYRASGQVSVNHLPGFDGTRQLSTAIYFMLTQKAFSAFHRIKSDEIWHFYQGSSIVIYGLTDSAEPITWRLGDNPEQGESFQVIIPAGVWFAAELGKPAAEFGLVGCTVAPGFDFEDFEMGERSRLLQSFPQHRQLISRLSLPGNIAP